LVLKHYLPRYFSSLLGPPLPQIAIPFQHQSSTIIN
jgi:hypothetical protein